MKCLQAVRLDPADSLVYSEVGAAQDGEWLVSGSHAGCAPTGAAHRKPQCYCLTSFIGLVSHRRCAIAEVVAIHRVEYPQAIEPLVRHFMDDLGAPTLEAARAVAEDEAAYTADWCESFSPEVWIRVKRTPGDKGITEHYSVFKRLMIGSHKL